MIFFNNLTFGQSGSGLPLRGQGLYKWYFLQVYEAKLWGEKVEDIYTKPLELELKYKRNFKGEDIVKQSLKEMAPHVGENEQLSIEKINSILRKIFPDVKEGDVISAKFNPSNGIIFYLNFNKEIGKISDLELSKKFLDIWLGEKTNAPDLRNQLLGNNI